ncbi:MAG: hypothetical protein U5L00_06380 [Desulfovermiculus sp.]|nr:hypothetical protein [Desulfovermiculus sp.]
MYTKEDLICRLKREIQTHSTERHERFLPFLIFLENQSCHQRFFESSAIVQYFIKNAILSQQDEWFYMVLKKIMDCQNLKIDYRDYMGKTPLPLADYTKIVYDLR